MNTGRGLPTRYVADLPQPDHVVVMGVVNVTPDSFSDGGRWLEPGNAISHGLKLRAEGAHVVDVGGESTRPGARRPGVEEELGRVIPVVRELASAGVVVSVDTMRAAVAERAIEAGAAMVNDVSGGRADPDMLHVVAAARVPVVLMHWRGHSDHMQERTQYSDVVAEVASELRLQVDAAIEAGVAHEHIAIDPGIGFAKTADQNWTLLAQLRDLTAGELPVLVGVSRKSFIGALLVDEAGDLRPSDGRDFATTALSMHAALAGAWCVRVHEVPANLDAVRVAARLGAERYLADY